MDAFAGISSKPVCTGLHKLFNRQRANRAGHLCRFLSGKLGWSKESVGLALATGQVAGVLGQIPGGAITDAIAWKRDFAALGILMSMGAALIFAAAPQVTLVFVAEILDGLTAAIVPLAIAAISLGLAGQRAMSSGPGEIIALQPPES